MKAIKRSSIEGDKRDGLIPNIKGGHPRNIWSAQDPQGGSSSSTNCGHGRAPTYFFAELLAKRWSAFLGNSDSDALHFVSFIKDKKVDSKDILVSLDVVSQFRIPMNEAINIIRELVDEEAIALVDLCLRSTFFSFQDDIFEQTEGVAMSSPVIAN